MSYLPHTDAERAGMLQAIGVSQVEDLFANIPAALRSGPPEIPDGVSELEVLQLLNALASENANVDQQPSFLGAGAYHHYIPSAVGAITGRSEFYTSYTPYQAELSQGTLQVIYEYQTMISELTDLDVSNASLYDVATAVAEAAKIAINETGRERIAIAVGTHPDCRQVLRTYTRGEGFQVVELDEGWVFEPDNLESQLDDSVAAVIVQSPNFFGAIEPMQALADAAHRAGSLFIAVVPSLSLALLSPPGEYGADIAVGCAQSLGVPLSFGGPYLGMIAVRERLTRRLPGRIAGATVDSNGRTGFVLTLQAREQHIRREKATSNICTNHALMALAATVYLALMGPRGMAELADLCVQKAHYAARRIAEIPGYRLSYQAPFFHEFAVRTPVPASEVNRFLLSRNIIGGYDLGRDRPELADHLLLAFTELTTREQIDDLVATLAGLQPEAPSRELAGAGTGGVE